MLLFVVCFATVFAAQAVVVDKPCSAYHVTPDRTFSEAEFNERVWFNRAQYSFNFVPNTTVCPYVEALSCEGNLYMSESAYFSNGTLTRNHIAFTRTNVTGAYRVGAYNTDPSSPSNQVFIAYNSTFVVGHLCTSVPGNPNQSDHWLVAATTRRHENFNLAALKQLVAAQGLPNDLITIDQSNCGRFPVVHDFQ